MELEDGEIKTMSEDSSSITAGSKQPRRPTGFPAFLKLVSGVHTEADDIHARHLAPKVSAHHSKKQTCTRGFQASTLTQLAFLVFSRRPIFVTGMGG